jgi:hypothetical protein
MKKYKIAFFIIVNCILLNNSNYNGSQSDIWLNKIGEFFFGTDKRKNITLSIYSVFCCFAINDFIQEERKNKRVKNNINKISNLLDKKIDLQSLNHFSSEDIEDMIEDLSSIFSLCNSNSCGRCTKEKQVKEVLTKVITHREEVREEVRKYLSNNMRKDMQQIIMRFSRINGLDCQSILFHMEE